MKSIKYLILSLCMVSMASCNLDQYPYSDVTDQEYVKDAASVNNLVIGCYNALHLTMDREWALTELRSDNGRMCNASSTTGNNLLLTHFDQATMNPSNEFLAEYWEGCYQAIYRSNKVLASLGVVGDETLKNQYEGEAKFLRAYHYFNLVRLWGPVFHITKKTGADEARDMQRSTVPEIYELIESDLEYVVYGGLLPDAMKGNDTGRASMVAAKFLLAKVYITRYEAGDEKYTQAKGLLEEVIAGVGSPASGASLVPYDQIFLTSNEMNSEIIFAARYRAGNLGLGSPFGNYFAPVNNAQYVLAFSCYNSNRPTDELINLYDLNGDAIRKDANLKLGYQNETSGQWVDDAYVSKYISPVTAQYDGESDWPIMRVADALLLYAEVLNEMDGPSEEALKYLNMTRERAQIATYTLADLSSRYAFRMAVRDDRRMELAFENVRWFDLLRWGTASDVVSEHLATELFYGDYDPAVVTTVEGWQTMLPIPISVLNINPDVAQNVGF